MRALKTQASDFLSVVVRPGEQEPKMLGYQSRNLMVSMTHNPPDGPLATLSMEKLEAIYEVLRCDEEMARRAEKKIAALEGENEQLRAELRDLK